MQSTRSLGILLVVRIHVIDAIKYQQHCLLNYLQRILLLTGQINVAHKTKPQFQRFVRRNQSYCNLQSRVLGIPCKTHHTCKHTFKVVDVAFCTFCPHLFANAMLNKVLLCLEYLECMSLPTWSSYHPKMQKLYSLAKRSGQKSTPTK